MSLWSYQSLVEEAQRRQARRAAGLPLHDQDTPVENTPPSERAWPALAIALPRPKSLAREKAEQAEVIKVFQRFGVRKWKGTSQARRSKIGIGIPDIWVFGPLSAIGQSVAWWWETKSGDGWRFSTEQLEFADDCRLRGVLYGCGDRFAADVFCRAIGLREI